MTEGDAEVLLHAWAEWGESALERLNGMFAFAVWDQRSRRLSMAVDRFRGETPVLPRGGAEPMFASDVRALRAARRSVGQPDDGATAAFLAFGKLPALPATFFADVSRLPPARIAHWTYGQPVHQALVGSKDRRDTAPTSKPQRGSCASCSEKPWRSDSGVTFLSGPL